MAIELNVLVVGSDGQPVPSPIITLYVLDKQWHECPMEPRIRQQANFFNSEKTFAAATGSFGPFLVYGSVMAAGFSPAYFPMTPWDGQATLNIPVTLASFKKPFKTMPRFWKANLCGIRIMGLPFVPGMEGAPDDLFLSWFYDRYQPIEREFIRGVMHAGGYTHWLLSWPDSRDFGESIQQFRATCQELIADGFYPCVMLSSKDHDPADVRAILAGLAPVLSALVGVVPAFSVGWELSLWLTPTQVQQLIDSISDSCYKQIGTLLYVHFQEGYPSFQQPGGTVADFWKLQVGKLTGLLYQKILSQNDAEFLDSINDCLERFGGGFGMPTGFDFVALELTAAQQFSGSCSEEEGNRIGRLAINAPHVNGIGVSGSGNGS